MLGALRPPAVPRQRGQAMVEFALSFVILLILLTGLLDIARAFHYTIGLAGAARAGARHGSYFSQPTNQQPYLDDADIKAAVDQVLAGDGLSPSVSKTSASCIAGTDSNAWVDPPYASTYYPTVNNTPWLYVCYDVAGTSKTGTRSTPPAAGDPKYTATDLAVTVLARYGLFGGLSSEYLQNGGSLTSIPLTAYQHFSVQG